MKSGLRRSQWLSLLGHLGSFPMVLLDQPESPSPRHRVSIIQSTNPRLLEGLGPPHTPFLGAYVAASFIPCFLWGMML